MTPATHRQRTRHPGGPVIAILIILSAPLVFVPQTKAQSPSGSSDDPIIIPWVDTGTSEPEETQPQSAPQEPGSQPEAKAPLIVKEPVAAPSQPAGNTPASQTPQRVPIRVESPLSPTAFVQSDAAWKFKVADYEGAVEELKKLAVQYPQSVLVRRYLGIAYMKLNRPEDALRELNAALQLEPDSAVIQFYMGEVYMMQEKYDQAQNAYEQVKKNEPEGRYAVAAQNRISYLVESLTYEEVIEKPWEIAFKIGYEYDGNAIYKARDPEFTTPADPNAGRYLFEFDGSYTLYENDQYEVAASYSYSQSLYDDGLRNLNTYSNSAGISVTRYALLKDRPLILSVDESVAHVILNEKLFVFINTISTTAIYAYHDRARLIANYSFSANEYDDDTLTPELSERDGFSHGFALFHAYDFNDAGTVTGTIGWDYTHEAARGRNFVSDVNGMRATLEFPVINKTKGEMEVRYEHDERPKYVADDEHGPRRDDIWEFSLTLQHQLREWMTLEMFFAYARAFSKNNEFEYSKAYGGTSLNLEF